MDKLNIAKHAGVLAVDRDNAHALRKEAAPNPLRLGDALGLSAKIIGTMIAVPALASAYLGYITKRTVQSPESDREFERKRFVTKLLADANLQEDLRNDALRAQIGAGGAALK